MEFRKILALRGPNMWANFPVLEAWVDLGPLKDSPSDEIPGFNERLMAWLPGMVEHQCSIRQRGGFFERLRRGTYQAHILEHVTLELQELVGARVGYGRAREIPGHDGVYKVVVEYKDEEIARACLATARRLCLAAVYNLPFDLKAELEILRELAEDVRLGPSTGSIVDAATARGIPVRRLNTGSLVMFGLGCKQRRILTAETDRTSAVAQEVAQDKDLTRVLLRSVGVPVPTGWPVTNAEEAWEAAQDIDGPVVVKPRFGNQGKGVTTNLTTREQVITAYNNAVQLSSDILVESFAPGHDYRVLVVNEKVVAAARRDPAQVIGDGVSSIRKLVEEVNRDPRRTEGHATALTKIKLDPIALTVLEEQGYTPDSIPREGERVLIRRNANLSTGGTATDVTDEVHPEVAARAVDAARVVGLDIAGIDIVARDISRPLEEQGGVVVEVNAGPGLRMHLQPSAGQPRPVGEAIIKMIYPEGENGRIPIVAVTGVNGKTTTTRLVGHILRATGQTIGMTNSDGIYIDGRRIEAGDCSGPKSARAVLVNPKVEAAAFEVARGGILREGLGFDACDVAIVMNIGEGDHLGLSGIETLERLAFVKRTIIDVVLPTGAGVLKADDPLVANMAPKCPGSIIFFCQDEYHSVVVEHRAKGGRAVFVRDGHIILAQGEQETDLVPLSRIPLTYGGRIKFQVENAMAAIAATWHLGLPLDTIRIGLASFTSDTHQVPGRFNVLESNEAVVVIDYGHNPSALHALIEALDMFPQQHRSIIYSAEGDRRDVDILRQMEILGDHFDAVLIYEYPNLRGRERGEILNLLRSGLLGAPRTADVVEMTDEMAAVRSALQSLQSGEMLVIQPKEIDEVIAYVEQYLAKNPVPAAATESPRASGRRVLAGAVQD